MKWLVVVGLLCVGSVVCSEPRPECQVAKKITPEKIAEMRQGLQAGRQMVEMLEKGDFIKAVEAVPQMAPPWTKGITICYEIVECFFDDTLEIILKEVKRGFREVNARLDIIIRELGQIKKLIRWGDMKVRFGDIEYRIRVLDDALKQVFRSPNRKAGISEFNRIYAAEYRNAGFALYDAVANNDHIFSMNLLKAAAKYSENFRAKTQSFSRGLFGLIIKAINIELANAKFAKNDIGQRAIWIDRTKRCSDAMKRADHELVTTGWIQQSKIDADRTAQAYQENSHGQFANELFKWLNHKFPWRYWMVAAFDSNDSTMDQASVLPNHGHRALKKFKKSYFVASTDPKNRFDVNRARSLCRNYACRELPHICCRDKAVWMMRLSPSYGVARFVVRQGMSVSFRAQGGRSASGDVWLSRPTGGWYQRYKMFYFG